MERRSNARSVSATGGMRPFPREKQKPIEEMKRDELLSLQRRNETLLRGYSASSSQFFSKLQETQAKVLHRLAELDNMESLQRRMRRATISEDTPMAVDETPPPVKYKSRFQAALALSEAQQRNAPQKSSRRPTKTIMMDIDEAIALEEQRNAFDRERRAKAEARRQKLTMPSRQSGPGRFATQEEFEKAMWAFMNQKPSESDLDDDDDYEDPEDEDPATYFDDEEDDGIKGQNIVYPDAEDYADVIRVDTNKMHYSTFYEPRDPS